MNCYNFSVVFTDNGKYFMNDRGKFNLKTKFKIFIVLSYGQFRIFHIEYSSILNWVKIAH